MQIKACYLASRHTAWTPGVKDGSRLEEVAADGDGRTAALPFGDELECPEDHSYGYQVWRTSPGPHAGVDSD